MVIASVAIPDSPGRHYASLVIRSLIFASS
jgi:hypothetical protein